MAVFLLLVLASTSCVGHVILPKYSCPKRELYPCVCLSGSDNGVNVQCANTNLASLALGLKQVKSLMSTLRITNSNMEKLYGSVFKPLSVKKLMIEDTPIKDISDGTLDFIATTLEELYVYNSWLTRVPPNIMTLENLKVLSIKKSRISYLPSNAFTGLAKLEKLHLEDALLTKLTSQVFLGLNKVKILSLAKNQLTTIPKNCFKPQKNLEYLDISHNNLDKIEPYFFENSRRLLWLNISHNHLSNIQGRHFSRNGLLRVLHLNNNNLTRIDGNSFRGLRFLRRLYLSDNSISRIGRGVFRSISR